MVYGVCRVCHHFPHLFLGPLVHWSNFQLPSSFTSAGREQLCVRMSPKPCAPDMLNTLQPWCFRCGFLHSSQTIPLNKIKTHSHPPNYSPIMMFFGDYQAISGQFLVGISPWWQPKKAPPRPKSACIIFSRVHGSDAIIHNEDHSGNLQVKRRLAKISGRDLRSDGTKIRIWLPGLVNVYSLLWYRWPIETDGLPNLNSMVIFCSHFLNYWWNSSSFDFWRNGVSFIRQSVPTPKTTRRCFSC